MIKVNHDKKLVTVYSSDKQQLVDVSNYKDKGYRIALIVSGTGDISKAIGGLIENELKRII